MGDALRAKSRSFEEEIRGLYSEFSQMKNGVMLNALNVWHPPTDVCETEDEFVITCELAGIRKEDIRIQLLDDVVQISGTRIEKRPIARAIFHNLEINYGPFERNIRFPKRFLGAEPRASFNEGVLCVKIPASPPHPKGKVEIEVE